METGTSMFMGALFTKTNRWKQPKCLSSDEQINKMRYIYPMDHYSVLKRKEILKHGTTWRNLKALCYVKKARPKKDKYCRVPLI